MKELKRSISSRNRTYIQIELLTERIVHFRCGSEIHLTLVVLQIEEGAEKPAGHCLNLVAVLARFNRYTEFLSQEAHKNNLGSANNIMAA